MNFNPLVTDLFKIYKTRIWMSAINPASFASPIANQVTPFPPSLPLDRDRLLDSHARAGGNVSGTPDYHANSRGAAGPMWGDVYSVGLQGQHSVSTYNHMLQVPNHSGRYPSQPSQPHNINRGAYPPARINAPYGSVAYTVPEAQHGSAYDFHELKDESSNVVYDNQLLSLQDLSLGT